MTEKEKADADIFLTQIGWDELPVRPELPTMPYDYKGPNPSLKSLTAGTAWKVKASENNNLGYLVTKTYNDAPVETTTFANRIGYLVATSDTSATTVEKTGHVFGRLGQADVTVYSETNAKAPAYWGAVTGTAATVIIGVYPKDSSETGLSTTGKYIDFKSKSFAWATDL